MIFPARDIGTQYRALLSSEECDQALLSGMLEETFSDGGKKGRRQRIDPLCFTACVD